MSERSGVETLKAPAIRGAWGRAGRGFKACVAVGALVVVLAGAVVSSPVAGQEAAGGDGEVRIVARKLESGRIEFGLQQRSSDDTWGDRQLPRVRFFPTTAGVGRWLASSALDLPAGEVRIVARKLESGRIEFGLQQRQTDDTWGDRRLPRVRFFPTTAGVGRWLASSALTLTAPQPAGAGNESATTTDQRPTTQYSAVTAGDGHSCALRTNGTIECWGWDTAAQTDVPAGQYTAIDSGGKHACALRGDGTIECWGDNGSGQADAPDGQYRAISAGELNSCALRTDGTIKCWGEGIGGLLDAPTGQYSAIAVGRTGAGCALSADGTITCWPGSDAPPGQYTAIALNGSRVAGSNSCALSTDGTIECWGSNFAGQADAPSGQYSAIAAGVTHSCAIRTDGTITCWGWGEQGQTNAPAGQYSAVAAGDSHSCGLRTDGTITCWGQGPPAEAPNG